MKKIFVAAAAAIVLAGLAVAAVPLAERYAAARIKAEIASGGQATVGSVEVGLFDRRVVLVDLKARLPQELAAAELTVQRLDVSGLAVSFTDLLQGRTSLTDFKLGDPLHADRLDLHDVRMVHPSAGARWSVASLTIEGFDLARYDAAAVGPYRFAVLSARIAAALSMKQLRQKTLLFTLPGSGDTVGVGDLALDAADHGNIGAIAIDRLEAAPRVGDDVAFKIDTIRIKGADLNRILGPLVAASWTPATPVGRAELASFNATGFGGSTLARYGLSLGSISGETTHGADNDVHSHGRVEGLVLAPGIGPESLKMLIMLQTLGLKEIRLGLDCDVTEQRGKGEFTMDACRLRIADLADLALKVRLVNADAAFWQALDGGGGAALGRSAIALEGASLTLADKGVLDRSAQALAKLTGQTVVAARAKLASDIRSYQPPGVLITEELTKIVATVATFVEKGGTLTLEAKPDTPVGLSRANTFRQPGPDLVDLFGVTARLSP